MEDFQKILYNSAKDLFSLYGFKKTSVSDITKQAGIAAGTFYNYYKSKDTLFMNIYIEENRILKEEILKKVNTDGDPMFVSAELMRLNYEGMMNNPILKEWYNREIFRKIEKKFREENGTENLNFLYDIFIEVIKKWQDDGKMRQDITPDMIMAIFSAVINVDLHKEEVGIEYFPEIITHLMTFVIEGLKA